MSMNVIKKITAGMLIPMLIVLIMACGQHSKKVKVASNALAGESTAGNSSNIEEYRKAEGMDEADKYKAIGLMPEVDYNNTNPIEFLRGRYPPSLHSEGFTQREPQWYKDNWEEYFKDKINESNTFIYLRSRDSSEIELSEINKYRGTSTLIYTVYNQEELETLLPLIKVKVCIWIDKEAVGTIDKDWLNDKTVKEKYPVILIGNSNALYSFRDLLEVCRYMEGPEIPDDEIQKDGFSAYLLLNMSQQENLLTVHSILKGFPGTLNTREIVSISNKMLSEGNGLVDKENMSWEERLRYNFWMMKTNPDNEELVDNVLLSFRGINWSRLYGLDFDDVFLIMEWFVEKSLSEEGKIFKAFLGNRDGLDAAVTESYYGWLLKILEVKTEFFVKGFATLSSDDIEEILFYLKNELDGRPVLEKRLKEVQEGSVFNEKEKEVLSKMQGLF